MKEIQFNFEDLKVYQKSLDFVDIVYEISKEFLKDEKFGLTSQFTRAAVSISLNIAEGAGDTNAPFNRFLKIASRQHYINQNLNKINRDKLEELSKMIVGLQKYLNSKNISKD